MAMSMKHASMAALVLCVVKDYAFVTEGEPQGLARRFLDFAASPEGNKILVANGIVAMR